MLLVSRHVYTPACVIFAWRRTKSISHTNGTPACCVLCRLIQANWLFQTASWRAPTPSSPLPNCRYARALQAERTLRSVLSDRQAYRKTMHTKIIAIHDTDLIISSSTSLRRLICYHPSTQLLRDICREVYERMTMMNGPAAVSRCSSLPFSIYRIVILSLVPAICSTSIIVSRRATLHCDEIFFQSQQQQPSSPPLKPSTYVGIAAASVTYSLNMAAHTMEEKHAKNSLFLYIYIYIYIYIYQKLRNSRNLRHETCSTLASGLHVLVAICNCNCNCNIFVNAPYFDTFTHRLRGADGLPWWSPIVLITN